MKNISQFTHGFLFTVVVLSILIIYKMIYDFIFYESACSTSQEQGFRVMEQKKKEHWKGCLSGYGESSGGIPSIIYRFPICD